MFVKDSSGLVINKNDEHYKSILVRRQQKKKMEDLDCKLAEVTDELQQIKSMLKDILDGKNHG